MLPYRTVVSNPTPAAGVPIVYERNSQHWFAYYEEIGRVQQMPPSSDPVKNSSDRDPLAVQMSVASAAILIRVESDFDMSGSGGCFNGEQNG